MRELHSQLAGQVAEEERELFDVYVRMLDDDALGNEVVERIKMGSWAQGALAYVANEHVRTFEMMSDEYLRERATDIRDLCSRVLFYLQQEEPVTTEYLDDTILVSEELTPAMLVEVPTEKLKASYLQRAQATLMSLFSLEQWVCLLSWEQLICLLTS